MASVIEIERATAQDIDLFERELTQLLLEQEQVGLTHRQKLTNSHKAASLVDRIVKRSQALSVELDDDRNPDRVDEIAALAGSSGQKTDLQEFYDRLARVKDYHRKYPDVANEKVSVERSVDYAALEQGDEQDWLDKKFTGEESLGRYLDLTQVHERWNNLGPSTSSSSSQQQQDGTTSGWKRLTYLEYLAKLADFGSVPITIKSTADYAKYLTALYDYLVSFYERRFPLGDLDAILKRAETEFATLWDQDKVPGWSADNNSTSNGNGSEGIWCAACQKMYSKETVYNAHLTSKKHLKAVKQLQESSSDATTNGHQSTTTAADVEAMRRSKNRALALKETLIRSLVDGDDAPLKQTLADTIANTERRAALTDRERATELEELEAREAAEAAAAAAKARKRRLRAAQGGDTNDDNDAADDDDDDDDEEERIYNPLKLPLGWDGKPIPYWLYKLHGLGVEYKCEICSDYVYMGRKNFERHFQEARHAFGMRALGLPNTKHFHEITKIADAIARASCPSPLHH